MRSAVADAWGLYFPICSGVTVTAGGSSATDATIAQFVLANCKVIADGYDPDAPETTPAPTAEPTATPEPTPGIVGEISYTNAPYAGVY